MTLALAERKAWNLYLAQIRKAGDRYESVEPWAWAELQATLETIERKRPKVKVAA